MKYGLGQIFLFCWSHSRWVSLLIFPNDQFLWMIEIYFKFDVSPIHCETNGIHSNSYKNREMCVETESLFSCVLLSVSSSGSFIIRRSVRRATTFSNHFNRTFALLPEPCHYELYYESWLFGAPELASFNIFNSSTSGNWLAVVGEDFVDCEILTNRNNIDTEVSSCCGRLLHSLSSSLSVSRDFFPPLYVLIHRVEHSFNTLTSILTESHV